MTDQSGVEQRLRAGVEFSGTATKGDFCGLSLEWFDFTDSVVADLTATDTSLAEWVLSHGARQVYVCDGVDRVAGRQGLERWHGDVWDFPFGGVDYVFFDPRSIKDFDYVSDAMRAVERIASMLSPGGSCFIVLRSGQVQTDWDVFNSALLTPMGRLPSSPYLYNSILGEFAVRPLLRLKEDASVQCVTRVFKLSARKPSLLLIVGHSQSGKTTLARSLLKTRPGTHVSSDYVYFNLFQMRGQLKELLGANRLSDVLGEATAEDTGRFFRSLDADQELLGSYLTLVSKLLPPTENLLSFDIDLRESRSVAFAKEYFESQGYVVWVVTR